MDRRARAGLKRSTMIFAANDDLPRSALPALENALLWSMQAWVVGLCKGADVAGRIGDLYADLGAPTATGYLDGFMWTLSQGATRMLEVNCVCCDTVSADERALLDVFALQQQGQVDEALGLLRGMMTPGAALAARSSAARLIAALNEAGQYLPEAEAAVRRHTLVLPAGRIVAPMPSWVH
ncbi:hypothetical protein HMPREF9946_01612 [Acetobacteraceae bacterium AT-5844]|nr:hypothetical protein HMPREF9946_01612 [Acetobacteraceae bacterium AT-5844]